MATKKKPETRLAVIVEYPAGPRAAFTLPVGADLVAAAERAEARRAHLADSTGFVVRVDTFTHVA